MATKPKDQRSPEQTRKYNEYMRKYYRRKHPRSEVSVESPQAEYEVSSSTLDVLKKATQHTK